MQTLFDPVISDITSLLSEQVEEAKTKKNVTIDVKTTTPTNDHLLLSSKANSDLELACNSSWWIRGVALSP